MTRLQANRNILKLLASLVESFPDQRFHQLLVNADVLSLESTPESGTRVVNEYQVESDLIQKRIKKSPLWKAAR